MPMHSSENTSLVLDLISRHRPKSILDLGCGSGSYGLLFRDFLDRQFGRYHKGTWAVRIDAVDIWDDYITPVHSYVYDNIVIGDVRELVKAWPEKLLPRYDAIFFGDVLEHLSLDDGTAVLAGLRQRGKRVVISTPLLLTPQGAYNGNAAEAHLCCWTADQLLQQGYHTVNAGRVLRTAVCDTP